MNGELLKRPSETLMTRSGKVIARDDDGGGMPDARLEVTLPDSGDTMVKPRSTTR